MLVIICLHSHNKNLASTMYILEYEHCACIQFQTCWERADALNPGRCRGQEGLPPICHTSNTGHPSLSPNHGLFGNDGLHSESKISLESCSIAGAPRAGGTGPR